MKSGKKHFENLAKTLYKNSLTGGVVDEKKVKIILQKFTAEKPAGLSSILKFYKRLIEDKISKEQIVIETGTKVDLQQNLLSELKRKSGVLKIINKVNPSITFGAKFHWGDWVWDDTLEGKLKQMTKL